MDNEQFFFSLFLCLFSKYRNKRQVQRRSDSVNEHSALESQRDSVTSATVENVSSDDEMVDIETTEENSLTAHSTHRSIRYVET